jgi:hypothetical protein
VGWPQAVEDLTLAVEAGRFTVSSPTLALVAAAGCLVTFLAVRLDDPASLSDAHADELTASLLVMLGMDRRAARALAHRPLPSGATAACSAS